jgi:hypothetical protein
MQGHENTYLSKLRRPFVEDAEHYRGEGVEGVNSLTNGKCRAR